jgi:hypothetical protein
MLIRVNPENPSSTTDFVCDLCTAMPQPTDEGRTYTFQIRQGVKFHDGSPLTVEDVAASWNKIVFPPEGVISARGAGWLRFLWEKATTRDDWSSAGIPHPWWDRYTAPVVLSYGRFDLSYSAYGLLLMADQTPAWREVYTRIADELASRYPTHWGAIDWFTQIGDDPKRANYPPAIMGQIPANLRGKYNRFGWTANGIEPWGLQSDPIGADGYLFFRAWFLLLLATHKYISGDDKWARTFKVTGYHDETFDWDMANTTFRLGVNYVGLMDDLSTFRRPLTAKGSTSGVAREESRATNGTDSRPLFTRRRANA